MTEARGSVGGGGLWLAAAKLWFLVAGYGLAIALTHLLAPELYGRYSVVGRVIAVPNMVIIYTMLFSVSRPLATQFDDGCPNYEALRWKGFRMALLLGGSTALVLFGIAELLADLFDDEGLAGPLRVVAPISFVYAVYAVNVGSLNAVRRFSRQAALDITMSTLKTGLTLAAAAGGLSLVYVVGGFTAAAVSTLLLSMFMVIGVRPRPKADATPGVPAMARFAGMLIVFTGAVNLLQSVDLLILQTYVASVGPAAVGYYAAALQVALVPYSLMNAVALVAFPLVASIDRAKEPTRVREYLRGTAQVCLLLLTFCSAVGSASAGPVQMLLFPGAYQEGASQLRLLVWGFSGYSFAVTIAWVFNSAERSLVALGLVLVPLVAVVLGTLVLVPQWFALGAATSVAIAGGAAVLAGLFALRRSFGAAVSVAFCAKLVLAVLVVEAVARFWPEFPTSGIQGKLMIIVRLAVSAAAFIAVIVGTKAVTLREIRELRHVR